MDATFHRGNALMVPYTPSGAVAAGDVIVLGDKPFVSHRDIAAAEDSNVAASGGTYLGVAAGNYAPGQSVFWNNTTKKFVNAAATGAHKHFGFLTANSDPAADGDIVEVEHSPNGGVSAT
jgi:predicted RecA/RadA family phage recombinase